MPGIYDSIQEHYKTALKAREKQKVEALRLFISEIKYEILEKGSEVTTDDDAAVSKALSKSLKKREDSFNTYKENDRNDLAEQEKFELDLIKTYLPAGMTEDELIPIIKAVLEEEGIKDRSGMGQAMKKVMEKTEGRAPGKLVSELVKNELA